MKKSIIVLLVVLVLFSITMIGCSKEVNPLVGKYRIEGISEEDKLGVGYTTRSESLSGDWKPDVYNKVLIKEGKEGLELVWLNKDRNQDGKVEDFRYQFLTLDNNGVYTMDELNLDFQFELVDGVFTGVMYDEIAELDIYSADKDNPIKKIQYKTNIRLVKIED